LQRDQRSARCPALFYWSGVLIQMRDPRLTGEYATRRRTPGLWAASAQEPKASWTPGCKRRSTMQSR